MRLPQIIPAHNLAHNWPATDLGDGRWTPARPEPPPGGPRWRLIVAWRVFTGQYDALRWTRQ